MSGDGYAVVTLDGAAWTGGPGGVEHAPLASALGANELAVDAYRLAAGGTFRPSAALETLLVPLEVVAPLEVSTGPTVPPHGLGRLPAGVGATVRSQAAATVLAVGAPAGPAAGDESTAVDIDSCEFAVPATSDVATAFLTTPLGCAGMKVNVRRLEPGQAVPYHTEGDQEELFVPISGPAAMRIADRRHRTPVGTVVRVAPDVPRSAVNDGDAGALWVMVGAPPTGGPTDWDPGAAVVD